MVCGGLAGAVACGCTGGTGCAGVTVGSAAGFSSSFMAFLKPLIDSPTSVPRFFSFLVPNTSTTTTRMTIQCFQSKMPMLLLLSNSYSGGRARGFLGVSGETETTVQFIKYSLWMLPQLG